ncbi:hypothetical protein LTR49_021838 [Elasticomyces elasticus]|nr:hypothetical protein LTR49_021838 [Elasticomyces elasticus]
MEAGTRLKESRIFFVLGVGAGLTIGGLVGVAGAGDGCPTWLAPNPSDKASWVGVCAYYPVSKGASRTPAVFVEILERPRVRTIIGSSVLDRLQRPGQEVRNRFDHRRRQSHLLEAAYEDLGREHHGRHLERVHNKESQVLLPPSLSRTTLRLKRIADGTIRIVAASGCWDGKHASSEQAVGQDIAGAKEKGLADSSSKDGPNPAKPDKPVKSATKTTKPADKTTDAHNKPHNVFDKFRSETDEKLFNFTESGEVLLLKAKAIEWDLEWLK